MKERLESIKQEAIKQIQASDVPEKLNDVRVKFLGKKGELTAVLKGMKDVAPEERPKVGQLVNETRAAIEELLDETKKKMDAAIREEKLKQEVIDVTLPSKKNTVGHRHPNTIALEEVERIFIGMGYEVVEGPEVEYDLYNFVKLNIPAILTAATGSDASGMGEIIETVLSGDPATVKALLGGLLNADLSGIQNATINQITSWAKDGIPMNIKIADNGHVHIYLDKSAFDNLFTLRSTGETDNFGEPVLTNDLIILWNALVAGGVVPEEAQAAGIFIQMIGGYWSVTTNFNLGLDLVRN